MDRTQQSLREETEKWLSKLRKERPGIRITARDKSLEKSAGSALRNMDAYISDTAHFLEKGDLVRAFEAVIYAWGIVETLERTGLVERKK